MSYPEKGNPHKRSWANPPPDMTGIVRILAEISANSVTSYKERKEASEKYMTALNNAREQEIYNRLNFPSFSEEQRGELSEAGYAIYRLHGRSLQTLVEEKEVTWPWRGYAFERERSMKSEVAINPFGINLWGTSGKNFHEQMKVFDKFKSKLQKKMPGVTAKVGTVADYIDLELSHKSRNFGRGVLDRYYSGGVRTASYVRRGYYAVINTDFSKKLGINLTLYKKDQSGEFIDLAPLIIPTGIHWKEKK